MSTRTGASGEVEDGRDTNRRGVRFVERRGGTG